jgi:Fe2+ transport system protein FeoA
MQCRLCGFDFDSDGMACHTGCPFGSKCNLICCPNCGYQVVDDRRSLAGRLMDKLQGRSPKPAVAQERPAGLVPLSHVAAGKNVIIRDLRALSTERRSRLGVFGLSPGESVTVLQRTPAPVIRIGETELALELDVLSQIWVESSAPAKA